MKTSRPRTFSSSSTITSPSEKRPTMHRPRLMFMCFTTAAASCGLALPVKMRMRSNFIVAPRCDRRGYGWGGRDRTYECRNQNPVPYHLATPQGKTVTYEILEGRHRLGKRPERVTIECT